MKIGIDIRMIGTNHGGIGRYVFELVNNILQIDSESQYYLFYNENNVQNNILNTFKKYKNAILIPTSIRHYSLLEQTLFVRILNKFNFDLVHFPNFNVPVWYKGKFIVTIHDVVHHKIGGAKKTNFLHFLAYKKVISNAVKKAVRIITVSKASAEDIAKVFQISLNKIEIIYEGNCLNPDVSETAVEIVKKRYFLTKPYFLFVGVLERKKNIVNLTRGFDVFLKTFHTDMDLVIVGKIDKHYPDIKFKAMDIKYKDHLVFTGFVEDEELKALYKGAYAFVSASLHEGYGLPGVEAMNFSLPLVVSNTPVFNEIYDNAAIYFDPLSPEDIAEKLNLVVKDLPYYQKLSLASISRSNLFNWRNTAKSTLDVYLSV